ncbi:MAG TPA: oligosaccharide flippase family protein [Terriglobales bacterium]|nr:oligosaccharide flippase family protein [Terriglobales bacterium]
MAAQYIAECASASCLGSDPQAALQSAAKTTSVQTKARKARSTFASDVLKLVSGSASAQVLTILTAPLIARLFAPAAFGMAAVFVSITGVISAIVGMRYELSVVLPEKDEDAANAMAVALSFIVLTSGITGVLLLFGGSRLLRYLHAPELQPLLWLAPMMVLLNGVFAALSYWNTRKKKFGRQTIAQVSGATFFVAAQVIAGLLHHSSGGVIITATVLSILVSTLVLGWQTSLECWQLFIHNVRFARMWATVKRYSNFPRYSTASAVLNNFGWQVPTFMLSGYFSSTVVGHYALGNKVLRIPVNLVGANIATVFFQHASEVHHQGTLRDSVERMFRYLIAIFLFPSLMLCLIGKDLFMVAFGGRWAEAGVYTEILSIYVLFWFMAVPLGIALNVLEQQAMELRLVIMILLTRVVALWVGGTLGNARLTLALFSIVGVLVYGYFCVVVLRLCAVPIVKMASAMVRNTAIFVPAGVIIVGLKYLNAAPMIIVVTSTALLGLYYAHVVRSDSTGREILSGMLRKVLAVASS